MEHSALNSIFVALKWISFKHFSAFYWTISNICTLICSQMISFCFRQQENLVDNQKCQVTMQQNTINLIKTVICWIPYPQKLKWWPQMRPFGPKLISRCCPVQKEIRTAWLQTPSHSANRPKKVGNENSQDPWKITILWYIFQYVFVRYLVPYLRWSFELRKISNLHTC